ncbi:MAG TPA: peptidoglycan-associated lipoprotein Pal [Methylotenera sp.]|jgi:peptidoglycan-associated lipoprotein|nr:peptidoglycan-associated lipoprotein Pal [Methylotenera sp.]HQS44083.1 peptidoglycan-associated lipoprotein Pal [Methylotenera sp.]
MNKSILNKKLLGSLILAMALSACKSTPMADKPAAVEDKSPTTTSAPAAPASDATADTAPATESMVTGNPLTDPNNILSKRSVYFDFDKDTVKEEFRPLIEAHAKYLAEHANAKVILQGNADERGTREYNLSLGQRRAVAVKQSLNLLSAQDKQIETVSFGEEKATANCKDEACHQTSRRVDIVYEGE